MKNELFGDFLDAVKQFARAGIKRSTGSIR